MTLDLPQPVFDANASGGGFGDLPDWDLTDLYPSADGAEKSARCPTAPLPVERA